MEAITSILSFLEPNEVVQLLVQPPLMTFELLQPHAATSELQNFHHRYEQPTIAALAIIYQLCYF